MRALHSTFVWVFVAVWSAFWVSAAMVVMIVSPAAALAMARRIWVKPISRVTGVRFLLEPLPDIDWSRPHVFAMNHQSTLDIPVAVAVLPVSLRIVAKHSLRYMPFLGWYMWATGMIFVNRSNRSRAVASLQRAVERIRSGASILIFPEGTRSRDRKIRPFKKGAFAMALEAGVPIVPVAIEGSGAALPAGAWTLFPGEAIRVKVGPPIPTEGRSHQDREALTHEVREAVIRLHREIGGQGGDAVDALAGPLPDEPKPGAGAGALQVA